MKLTARNTHRDLAYFYLGLIISFSLSGIFLNHRRAWHPMRYEYASKEITLSPLVKADQVDDDFLKKFSEDFELTDRLQRYAMDENILRITYADHNVEVDLETGKGKIGEFRQTPLLGQMTELHVTTNNWWIYYSDIFGIGMLTIAITGMFVNKGKFSFKKRGWKLAVLGILFPLIFLFLLS
ncbi:MAG: PepSY-associated TM helix domain-containing protein [Saprospiraceae bacterium]|nr:PepSY-associated TM helix domain-containing protein [Saprospiraceae bacterium]